MPSYLIRWSIENRLLVVMTTLVLGIWGWASLKQVPLDAIPDLSDVQIIIRTSFPGQSPRVVEEQVTYPITTTMLAVPGAKAVRGYSFFGDSFVYVIFEDGTDLYWARARVLEYLNQAANGLPPGVQPRLGPDATGVGWIYSYALVDRSGRHDLSQLRSIQDWFLKFELQSVPGVAEVATVGGMVRQYQVVVDPEKLRAYGIPLSRVTEAVQRANREAGGSVVELGEAEYMMRTRGYLQSLQDIRDVPLGVTADDIPILLGDRGACADRPGDAPRGRRPRRRGRGHRRHRGHAPRRECAEHDRRGQGAYRDTQGRACRPGSSSSRPMTARR